MQADALPAEPPNLFIDGRGPTKTHRKSDHVTSLLKRLWWFLATLPTRPSFLLWPPSKSQAPASVWPQTTVGGGLPRGPHALRAAPSSLASQPLRVPQPRLVFLHRKDGPGASHPQPTPGALSSIVITALRLISTLHPTPGGGTLSASILPESVL